VVVVVAVADEKRRTNLTVPEVAILLRPTCSVFPCNTRSTTMSYGDMKTYRTFEEFEREELRRMDAVGNSVDEMIDTIFGEELDLECVSAKRRSAVDEDDEE
jgi:hypothetical protein